MSVNNIYTLTFIAVITFSTLYINFDFLILSLYKFLLYYHLPEDGEHSPKHVGKTIRIDNVQVYTFYVHLLVHIINYVIIYT